MGRFKLSGTTFLGAVLAVGLLSAPAFASYTRIVGMGMNNWNVMDGFNIWLNPAWTAMYSNVVIAELGTNATVANAAGTVYNTPNAGTQWGGMIHDHKDKGSFGMFIRRPYGVADANGNYGYGASGYFGPTTRADLIGNTTFLGTGMAAVSGTDIFLDQAGAFGPGDAAGTNLLANMGGTNVGGAAIGANGAVTAVAPTHRFDFFWGKKDLIAGWDWGINISWAGAMNSPSYTRSTTTQQANDGTVVTDRTSNDWNFGVGTIYHMNNATIPWIEAAINLGMPSYSSTRTETNLQATTGGDKEVANASLKTDGATAMDIFLRAQVNWDTNEVGYLTFRMASGNVNGTAALNADVDADGSTLDDYDRTGTWTDKVSGWILDHAKTFTFSDRLMAVMTVGVASMTVEQAATVKNNVTAVNGTIQSDSMKNETFTVPVSIAAEHKTLDWLTTRFGLTKNVYASNKNSSTDLDDGADADAILGGATDSTPTNERKFYADTALIMNTGVSMMIAKDFGVDAVLRQGILFGGPYFISGVPNSMFGQLTAWYKF